MNKKLCSVVAILLAVLLLAACGSPAATPGADNQPGNATGTEPAPGASLTNNNVLRISHFAPTMMDPHFGANLSDDNATRLMFDFLVFIDGNNVPDPRRGLAESWTHNEDGTVWTFNIRRGVRFHDGKPLTSRDVQFSFDRLRDPEVGSPLVTVFNNITDIQTPDDYTVVFTLAQVNPDFLNDLFSYQAKIVDADNTDFATNWNGTGPFILERFVPEDRLVVRRNPDYWLIDDQGRQLPLLDGVEFIFMADQNARMEGLRGGQIDFLLDAPAEFAPIMEADPNITLYRQASNFHFVIRMRTDQGPGQDARVRQALKAGTDRSEILMGAIGGLGVTGRDTPIGPIFGDFYLDVPEPVRNVELARELLAQAGFPEGFSLTLYTQQTSPIPAIATIWREQMAEIGVDVEIQLVPSEVYWDMWLDVEFGITNWGPRPYPQPHIDLAYITGAAWNETHWSHPRLDELAAQAAVETDVAARAQLYHEIQRIFIEEGPIIVPFFRDNLWATRANVGGFIPPIDMALDLRFFYFKD